MEVFPAVDTGEVPQVPQFRKAPAERAAAAVLPAFAVVWTAAEIMHLAGMQGAWKEAAIGTALAAALAWGASGRWAKIPRRLPWWIASAGGWLSLAVAEGPLHGWPYAPLTWTWVVASLAAWRMARRHEAVISAREWRDARADWLLGKSRRWGLPGSHLLKFERTRLGEQYIIDVRGTRKRASQIVAGNIAELIAEDHWDDSLPMSRVRVSQHLPGRIKISVQKLDPWAEPIVHPVLNEHPEITLPLPFSITRPSTIGQDPETGSPLDLLLCGPHGGRNISVVGTLDAGKTTLFNDIAERVTAAYDAILVKVNVSVKGDAEKDLWAPACHLTALGPKQGARAVKVMQTLLGVMEWRSQQPQGANWVPSARDPHIVVEIDEIDEAARIPAFKTALARVASKGREYGITIVRAGQRATADWTGGADTRALDSVFCIGKVRSVSEVYHAVGALGYDLPDMATFGEGKSGVWVITELGGSWRTGRSFLLKDPADIRRIVEERADRQPDLCPELRAFLGDSYEILLSTDVFAKWARDRADQAPAPVTPSGEGIREGMDSPLAPLAIAVRDGLVKVDPESEAALLQALSLAEQDALKRLDFDMDIDDKDRAKLAEIDAKLGDVRKMIADTAAMPKPPKVSREALDAHTAQRWRQVGEQAQIPEDARPVLLELLREGTTIGSVAEAIGVSKWIARTFLERLRNEGVAYVEGEKRNARWRLVALGEGGDGS